MLALTSVTHVSAVVDSDCSGEGREVLRQLCTKLPDSNCRGGLLDMRNPCQENEFHCGDRQCVPLVTVCDYRYDCLNAADELRWYVVHITSLNCRNAYLQRELLLGDALKTKIYGLYALVGISIVRERERCCVLLVLCLIVQG